jgi:hypothetical protein
MQHCHRPIVEDRPYCVIPGDVVIPRIPPLHASLVSDINHRHPIDGNCLLVRGLKPVDAAWLLALLNEEECESWFVARSASQSLPRIGLRDLRNMPFPEPPDGILGWSTHLLDWIEHFSDNASKLFSLQTEVTNHVSERLLDQNDQKRRLFPGVRKPAVFFSGDSWLPLHVEIEFQQKMLIKSGAIRLKDLVVRAAKDSTRLKEGQGSALRMLRISDTKGVYLPSIDPISPETRMGRFYAEPVRHGEVLVSSLVTYPKIAYVDPTVTGDIYPIDHWLRLLFRETPGAWTLILSSPAMGTQFRRLATGAVQQFTTADRLMTLCVPNIERDLRRRWQNRLDELLAERRRLDTRWQDLRIEGRRMVASVLNIPWSEMKKRSLK